MKKYSYKGKVVYIFTQVNGQIVYSETNKQSTSLKSIPSDTFFKYAKELKPITKNIITVAGRIPEKVVEEIKEEVSKKEKIEKEEVKVIETIKSKEDEEKEYKFKCEKCGNKYKTKSGYDKHMNTKHIEKEEVVESKVKNDYDDIYGAFDNL